VVAQLVPLAILSAITSPTAIAAVLVILNRPRAVALLAGYAIGSFVTSVAVGFGIIAVFDATGTFSRPTSSANAFVDLVAGALILLSTAWLRSSRSARWRQRAAARRAARKARRRAPSRGRMTRLLRGGSVGIVTALGAAMHLPGLLYLVALADIAHAQLTTAAALAVLVAFNVVMLLPIELPLLAAIRDPAWTREAVARVDAFGRRHERTGLLLVALVAGGYLVASGLARLP